MANIQLKIVGLGDFSSVNQQLKQVQTQVNLLSKSIAGIGLSSNLTKELNTIQAEFKSAMVSSGNFTAQTVKLTSETEKFGRALQTGKLKLGEYFGIITGRSAAAKKQVEALAIEQVKLNNSIVTQDITKQGLYSVYTPTAINKVAKATEIAAARQNIFNLAVREGSQQLINFGKNTQWAGRQLTVGLSMPVLLFGSQAMKTFQEVNDQLVRLQKVYGTGVVAPTQKAIAQIKSDTIALSKELASTLGVAAKDTAAMAADLAATGKTGVDLMNATREAMRLARLGELDTQAAMGATISLQNVYKLSTQELSGAVDFLNAVENQTSTSLQDLVDGIPRVGPIVQQLGGDFKDTALMMVAMKEAGVPAAQSANAIKSALASIINPTKKAREEFAAYNINVAEIAESTGGNPIKMVMALQQALKGLSSLNQAQLIETLFGKYQQARIQALITNLGSVNSQTRTAFELASASAPQLAAMAASEMKIATESTTGKFRRAVETLKADLIPVGEKIMEVATKILEFGSSIANFFNKLPGPIKSGLGILLTLGAIAGPVIMITGLFANLMGQVMRVGYSLWGVLDGSRKWKDLMTPAGIAAKAATDVFGTGLMANVAAVDTLNASITRLIMNIEGITTAMSMSTGAAVAGEAAIASKLLLPGMPGFRKKMATGGFVPGTGNTDSVPAMLMPGEAVIPKNIAQSQQYGPMVRGLLSGNLRHYAEGTDKVTKTDIAEQQRITLGGAGNRQQAHLSDLVIVDGQRFNAPRMSDLPPTAQAPLRSLFPANLSEAGAGKASVKSGAVAAWHSEVNQLANDGVLAIDKMIRYLKGKSTDLMPEGRETVSAGGVKIGRRRVKHDPMVAYRTLMDDLGIPDDERADYASDLDKSYIKRLKAEKAAGKTTIADPSKVGPGKASSNLFGEVFEQSGRAINPEATDAIFAPGQLGYRTEKEGNRSGRNSIAVKGNLTSGAAALAGGAVPKTTSSRYTMYLAEQAAFRKQVEIEATKTAKAIDDSTRKALDEHSNSRKGKKAGKEYVGGIKDGIVESKALVVNAAEDVADSVHSGVDKGLNSPAGQSKLQSKFSKAFGPQSRLGAMMSNPMGRVGASMGLTMGMQMLAPTISSKLGPTAGGIMNSAMSGASMGMAFGPWGAAAGAAIGLVTSGISHLIAMEKLHKAEAEAAFKSSAEVMQFFGETVGNTTHTMSGFVAAAGKLVDSANEISTGLLYSESTLDSFKKMVESLPKENALSLIVNQMKGLNDTDAKKVANQFVQVQMAINGLSKDKADQLLQLMLATAGKNATGAKTTAKDQIQAIVNTINSSMGNTKEFSNIIGQLTNLAVNTTSWEEYKRIIEAIGKSAATSSGYVKGLIDYLTGVGDFAGVTQLQILAAKGYSPQEITSAMKYMAATGKDFDMSKYKPGDIKITTTLVAEATKAQLERSKATEKLTSSVNGLTAAEQKNTDALKAKKKALDAEIKSLQDKLKAQQNLQDFNTTTTDIKNQILLAQASGDNLKAQLLQQQLIAKGQEYTAQGIIDKKQIESDKLGEQIAAAVETGNSRLNGSLGDNTTSTDNNTDALKAGNLLEGGKKVELPKSTSTSEYGTTAASANKYIDTLQAKGIKVPDFKGKWEQDYTDPETGVKSKRLTPEAMRYLVNYGNQGKGYEKGDQFSYQGTTYDVKTGKSAVGTAEAVPTNQVLTPSSPQFTATAPKNINFYKALQNYNTANKTKLKMSDLIKGDGRFALGNLDNSSYIPVIRSILKDSGVVEGDIIKVGNYKYRIKSLRSGSIPQVINQGKIKAALGGHILGPGTATSDSIPAYLSNGEYVINAASVSKYGKGMFDSLNTGRFTPEVLAPLVAMIKSTDYTRDTMGIVSQASGSNNPSVANHNYNVNVNVDKIDSTVDMQKAISQALADVQRKAAMSGKATLVGVNR